MKSIKLIFLSFVFALGLSAQTKYFNLTDTKFEVGMVYVTEIEFKFDDPSILEQFIPLIDSITWFLNKHSYLKIEIGVHSDSRGSAEYNQSLTQRRAQAIMDSLTGRGVEKGRLEAKGYGETSPRYLEKDYRGKTCGMIFPKGAKLTEEYIKQFYDKTDLGAKKFEDAHTLNRRLEITILSTDYPPK